MFGPYEKRFSPLNHETIAEFWAESWAHFGPFDDLRAQMAVADPIMSYALEAIHNAGNFDDAERWSRQILSVRAKSDGLN